MTEELNRLIERLRDFGGHAGSRTLARVMRRGPMLIEAADALKALSDECDAMQEALAWYGEQARLAKLIHSEGDAGRHALAADGGSRARAALNKESDHVG